MLKECKVLLNNEAVTVIRYDDKDVQIPALGYKADVVKVKDDGRYTVVPNDYEELEALPEKPKTHKNKPVIAEELPDTKED